MTEQLYWTELIYYLEKHSLPHFGMFKLGDAKEILQEPCHKAIKEEYKIASFSYQSSIYSDE